MRWRVATRRFEGRRVDVSVNTRGFFFGKTPPVSLKFGRREYKNWCDYKHENKFQLNYQKKILLHDL
jgi:hypothetical protein